MSCDDLTRSLASGEAMGEPLAAHIRTCTGCRAMMTGLNASEELPSADRLAQIAAHVKALGGPVRPLPSNTTMILLAMTMFVGFSWLAALPFGLGGFMHLNASQRIWYYATILLLALIFSTSLVGEIIPGSKQPSGPVALAGGSLVLLGSLVSILFPHFGMDRFVEAGMPCLRLGLVCSLIASGLAYGFVRRGYSLSPARTGATLGFLCGLAGVAVLALHCAQQNTPHIMLWHLGAPVISGAAGAALGSWRSR